MDIDSVKKAITVLTKEFKEEYDRPDEILTPYGKEFKKAFQDILYLASLVVNAKVVEDAFYYEENENLTGISKEEKAKVLFGIYRWNSRGEADRLLWSNVMLRLPEIIQNEIVRVCAVDRGCIVTQFEKNMAKTISEGVKEELGI